ncbi:unnamed protein product [Moneuplotes crassus]|uniref:AP2/ERF domain-containing protein n=1 Tax=Euplotes crassus TaxID=5936 RepID=A0AAD2D419_EUPCR|nr:unnamed protein product [Moneuplotes crassus]
MNFSNFGRNPNHYTLPTWSISDIINELSSVYCMSEMNERILDIQAFCLCSTQSELSIQTNSSSSKSICTKSKKHECIPFNEISGAFSIQLPQGKHCLNLKDEHIDHQKLQGLSKIPKRRKRRTSELDIKHRLLKLKDRILYTYMLGFSSTKKKAKTANKILLSRRSKYIGVSRNNSNWQALINVGESKKYIGTFENELQAARAYDLYSLALREDQGSLNFDYSKEEILERIEYYLKYNCVKTGFSL